MPDRLLVNYPSRVPPVQVAPEAAAQVTEHSDEEALTPREFEVMHLIAAGNLNKEVAAHLAISKKSVKKTQDSLEV